MTPEKRSAPQLDHNDLSTDQSTAGVHHFVLASFTAVALLVVYILINAPSASIGDLDNNDAISSTDAKDLVDKASEGGKIGSNDDSKGIEPGMSDKYSVQMDLGYRTSIGEYYSEIDANTHLKAAHSKANGKTPVPSELVPRMDLGYKMEINQIDEARQPDSKAHTLQLLDYLEQKPWITVTVKKRDTLTQIFKRNGIDSNQAIDLVQLDEAAPLLKIRPGQEIKLKIDDNGNLGLLSYSLNKLDTLNIVYQNDQYLSQVHSREPEVRINNAKATIYSTLLGAAREAGIPGNTMYEFVAMFGWQVDFAMDLRVGDQFSIIFEELYLDDNKVGTGKIIAAELTVSDNKLQAIRHTDSDGVVNYYAPNGDGVKGTFLRTPLKFGTITSNFSKNRLHPIKKVWRAHKGVDYGAPRGTPVLATGSGVVKKAGRVSGYGKTVIIRHGGKYETVYAHLNGYAKGIKSGSRVQQGEIIGYVGSTGLATGPHLHYEFRVNGVHMNPVTVEFPKSDPIPDEYRSTFQLYAGIWTSELDYLNRIPLAQSIVNQ